MIDLDKTLGFHASALRGIGLRQQVTAHNIANQNTPNYRARTVQFREVLRQAVQGDGDAGATDFPIELKPGLTTKANGNNVDLEVEWMQIEEDRLLHEIFSRAAGGTIRGLLTAIRGR